MKSRSFVPYIIIIFYCFLSTNGFATNDKKKYLFKLGEQKFYSDQFEYYFLKNSDELDLDSVKVKVDEYLKLYVKFRLKVLEAERLQMHKSAEFKKEFEGYKKQLAKPYLTESKMSDALVMETYERLKLEINASHILLKVDEDALPQDTLAAYNKLIEIKQRVAAGENFESFAYEMSEDPSAKKNKGNLGYFSAMRMVYPFESAAYNTEVNQVSDPIRTKFGYHIILVNEKRPARGKMRAAHIMIRFDQMGKQDPEQAEKKIRSIYEKLQSGEKWNELCKLYSEDFNTKNSGGELRWFGTGELIKEFEDAAYNIRNLNDYSEPVKTRFGWHIVKLLEKKQLAPLDEMRAELESKISRDSRSRQTKKRALEILKQQHNFTVVDEALKEAKSVFDSTLLAARWEIDSSNTFGSSVLIQINGKSYTTLDFWNYVSEKQRKRPNISIQGYVKHLFSKFEEQCLLAYEEEQLEDSNLEYRQLLEEYRSGILLFNLMEEKVWAYAAKDTAGLERYYQSNNDQYTYPEKADVRVFISNDENAIKRARNFLDKSKKEIDEAFNSQDPLHLQVVDKSVSQSEDPLIARNWQAGTYEYIEDGQYYLVQVKQIIKAGISPLDEVKGLVISDYQLKLEEDWVNELMNKYPLKINKGVLNGFIKEIKQKS